MGPCFGKEGIKAFVHAAQRLWKLRQNIDVRSDPDEVLRNYGPACIETEGSVKIVFVTISPMYLLVGTGIDVNATPQPSDEYKVAACSQKCREVDWWYSLIISLISSGNWQPIGNSMPIQKR